MQIPNKSQFKIDEVSSITGVKSYVLRFWESEFEQINPTLSATGQKLYDHKDVEVVALLKKLLFEDKLTIEEAKKELDILQKVVDSVKVSAQEPEREESTLDEREVQEKVESTVSESSHPTLPGSDHYALSKSDMQKIVLAKAKIESLLSMISDLQ